MLKYQRNELTKKNNIWYNYNKRYKNEKTIIFYPMSVAFTPN